MNSPAPMALLELDEAAADLLVEPVDVAHLVDQVEPGDDQWVPTGVTSR